MKNFCGSIADSVQSKSNILHIRYFAEWEAVASQVTILYTAYRENKEKDKGRYQKHQCCQSLDNFSLSFVFFTLDYKLNHQQNVKRMSIIVRTQLA